MWTSITVQVTVAACDQSGLGWDPVDQVTATIDLETGPTEVTYSPYTVNTVSKTATPEMRGCGGVFDESYTLTAVRKGEATLPSFMTFEPSTGVLTVTPTDEVHQDVYIIEVTQDNANG